MTNTEQCPFADRGNPGKRGMSTATILLLVLGLAVVVPCVLACGGCLLFVVVAPTRTPQRVSAPVSTEVTVYTPISEVVCATDPDFLDSSPLVAPARFVRVQPGTELLRVGFGGMFDKLYWELTADGRQDDPQCEPGPIDR